MDHQSKYKNVFSEIPKTAVDIYRMLPEGTRCEVIFNELVFPNGLSDQPKYKNFIPGIPENAVDVYRMLPEGTRCEVIFNELTMLSPPTKAHQLLLIKLSYLLFQLLEARQIATLLSAPFDVYFDEETSVVQPDLFIVLNEDEQIMQENGVYGVPAVVIEIVSTNRAYDTKRKKALYEKAGVKEYFMIDPENKKTTLLTLNSSGTYEQTYEDTGVFNSQILSCTITF
jgi:Uma2 family endonuclease